MKKSNNYSPLLLSLLLATSLAAQTGFYATLTVPDSSNSIFAQKRCFVFYGDHNYSVDEDGEETWSPQQLYQGDSCTLQVKFPHRDWMDCTERYWRWSNMEHRRDGFWLQTSITYHINLLPLYDAHPGLLEEVQAGGPLLVRYHIRAILDQQPPHSIYTNVDTMYLPPATPADLAAFHWLQEQVEDIAVFSYLGPTLRDIDVCNTLIEQFPSTIIAEIAKYHRVNLLQSDLNSASPRLLDKERRLIYISRMSELKNSPSDIVKDKATGLLSKYN